MRRRGGLLDLNLQRGEGLHGRDRDDADRRFRDASRRGEAAHGHGSSPGCLSRSERDTERDGREDHAQQQPPAPDIACPTRSRCPKSDIDEIVAKDRTYTHISPISLKSGFLRVAIIRGTIGRCEQICQN
jgi:hypothetical protein